MSLTGKKKVWITWDDHRRSRELADAFNCDYVVLESGVNWLVRYFYLGLKTTLFIIKRRPTIVISQNPSVVLSAMLCFIKPFFGFTLLVDRHSNFKINTRESKNLKWKIFHWFSDYSLRKGDLTIVTNQTASEYVEGLGARSIILPDKIPNFLPDKDYRNNGNFCFFFVCTFSDDEPVEAVLDGFSNFCKDKDLTLYVSGNYHKFDSYKKYEKEKGIIFLGYVDDQEYVNYMHSSDAIVVLTTMPMTLNCGSYEAVSAAKPQIVSDSKEISSYFYKGAISVSSSRFSEEGLADAFKKMIDNYQSLQSDQVELRKEIDVLWQRRFEQLNAALSPS
jgi:glycosyltransferase involved in cell wall biosynthesis